MQRRVIKRGWPATQPPLLINIGSARAVHPEMPMLPPFLLQPPKQRPEEEVVTAIVLSGSVYVDQRTGLSCGMLLSLPHVEGGTLSVFFILCLRELFGAALFLFFLRCSLLLLRVDF